MTSLTEHRERIKTNWVRNLTLMQLELEEEIKANGGRYSFPALFNLTGNLVAAKQVMTRRNGLLWGVLKTDSPDSDIIEWFSESKAKKGKLAKKHDAKKGYYVGYVLAYARVGLMGTYRYPSAARMDNGFSRDVIVVDNGWGLTLGTWYELIDEIG